jgi:hypothetical protein
MENHRLLIQKLLSTPSLLKMTAPFTRGADLSRGGREGYRPTLIQAGAKREAVLPRYFKQEVAQSKFLTELDENCHDVLFDDNIPSFHIKRKDSGDTAEIKTKKVAIPFQKLIKNKQLMHLTANPMQFTLVDQTPSDKQQESFITFKQYWDLRNQDGMKNRMVDT